MRKERLLEKLRAAKMHTADKHAAADEAAARAAAARGAACALFAKNAKGAALVCRYVSRMVHGPKGGGAKPTSVPVSETMRLARVDGELIELLGACGAPISTYVADESEHIELDKTHVRSLWEALRWARAQEQPEVHATAAV
jgi:hypothetical protein